MADVFKMKINPDKLKRLMLEKGVEPKDLAYKAKVSMAYIYQCMHGKSLRLKTINKLANALGVSPNEIIDE